MGISTIQSYQGAQVFEAVGIDKKVIDKYFTNTVSRIGGIDLSDIQKEFHELHSSAFDPLGLDRDISLESCGEHKFRSGKEYHRYNPVTIHLLQESTKNGDYKQFKEYTKLLDSEMTSELRNLIGFKYPEKGVSIDEVESVESIVKRFKTGAMSYGSISK